MAPAEAEAAATGVPARAVAAAAVADRPAGGAVDFLDVLLADAVSLVLADRDDDDAEVVRRAGFGLGRFLAMALSDPQHGRRAWTAGGRTPAARPHDRSRRGIVIRAWNFRVVDGAAIGANVSARAREPWWEEPDARIALPCCQRRML
jgi:hypothetical protein